MSVNESQALIRISVIQTSTREKIRSSVQLMRIHHTRQLQLLNFKDALTREKVLRNISRDTEYSILIIPSIPTLIIWAIKLMSQNAIASIDDNNSIYSCNLKIGLLVSRVSASTQIIKVNQFFSRLALILRANAWVNMSVLLIMQSYCQSVMDVENNLT